ncbi:fibronectin type III domain-containing protein [bacterium]|nr:MAG: fibronectin type III domain-containing protein [bacterium]
MSLVWNNGTLVANQTCGTYTAGAVYKMKIISGGFEVYKDGVLMCTQSTGVALDNKKIFLQSSAAASTFDDVLVTGNGGAPTAPGQVTGLSAEAGDAQVALTWSAPGSNGGSAITDYLVEYKLNSEPTTWSTFNDGTSTSTSATVTSLSNGSLYNFRVSAINAVGTGTASSTANATPSAPTAPAAPTIGTAVAGDESASVSFTPGSNGGSTITGYTVTSSPGGFTGTGSSSPITVSGLTNGVSYTFTVTATNAIGTSSASSASNAVTPNEEIPPSIPNLALWLDGADADNMSVSGDRISQVNDKSGNGKNATSASTARPTLVSNALNGRSVMNFDGSDDYFNIGSSITYRTVAIVAKKSTSAAFSNYPGLIGDFTGTSPGNGHVLNGIDGTTKLGSATSSFSLAHRNGTSIAASSGHDFSPLNEYWIGVFQLPSSMTNTTSSIGMINGGGRYWNGDIAEVIAYSSTITSDQRNILENYLSTKWNIAVSGPTVPGAPTSLGASRGDTQIGLSWSAPASNGGTAITDYIVEYKLSSEPTTWSTFNDGTSTSTTATITGLTNGLSYDFRVKAVNIIGTGTASGTATKTPGPPTAPDAPTGVSAEGGNTQATVSFSPPVDNGGASITSYTVTSSPGGFTASGASSPLTVTGLTNGVSYTFTVTATNSAGTSSASSASNSVTPSTLANQLTDSFTGTTINTDKWYEYDPTGSGGTTGKIQQNGSLTIADSYVGGNWAQNALISQDVFSSTSLEISASMISGSGPVLGYGDYQFASANKKAYLVYISGAGSSVILALSWDNTAMTQTSCGTASVGAAIYKMKIISGGFEVYKDNVLVCTHNTAVVVNNKPVFLQNSGTASTFDEVVVYGETPVDTVPDAPTIGTATAGNGSAVVTFTPPSFNGGSAITGYTVTSSPGGVTASGSSSPITVTGLTNDVAYTFTVKATNVQGDSAASSASNSATPQLPQAPGQVTGLVATGFNRQVLLGWDAPTSGGTPTDYVIEYKLSSEPSTWSTFNDGTSTSLKAIVTGLTNGSAYDFRVKGSNDGNPGTSSAIASATPDAISTLSFVITGESNSGGIGLNSQATVGELASRSAVQIMNLTSGNFLYENLDIGTNNLRDHSGLEGYYDCCHGFELQLANSTEEHAFPDNPQVYLVKTGHGGSQVTNWAVGQTYWTKFLQRTAAAKTQLPENRKWVVFLSLGINDAIAGNNVSTWKTNMIEWMDRIKADLPGAIIILTGFQSMGYGTYNTAINELAASEPNVYAIDSTGAALRDANHWSYAGLKTVTSSMVTVTKNVLGLNYPGLPTSLSANPSSTSVALSWTAPVSNGGSSITDYIIEYKESAASTWSTFNDGTSTTASATVTGLSSGTAYNFRVKAANSNGAGNTTSVNSTTADGTAPSISSVSATPGSNSASITWTTDENSSSMVEYGLTSSYGTSTSEADTSPRVTSHTVNLTNLTSCSTYYFRVKSNDAASNLATGGANSFTTTGCAGSATVVTQSATSVNNGTGGTAQLTSGSNGLELTIPMGAVGANATFQIKELDKTTVLANIGKPSGVNPVGLVFDLKSLTNLDTPVTSFNSAITLTFSYQESDVAGINESALVVYRYNGVSWSPLSDCVVNTSANTITCTTTQFSVFSIFGSPSVGGGLPSIAYLSPVAPSGGFKLQINGGAKTTSSSNVVLSFNGGSDIANMAISNTSDFSFVGQEKYSSGKQWDLCKHLAVCNYGLKTVYAKLYTSYGQSSEVITATIEYSKSGQTTKQGPASKAGANIKTADGTIYTVTSNNTLRPYTSAGAFLSYTFNNFKSVVPATTGDLQLPIEGFIAPRDGSIICSDRGSDRGTCYLIIAGKKAGFTSERVFKGLGYSFSKSQNGDVSFMEPTSLIDNEDQAHRTGTLVKIGKTIYLVGEDGLKGIPTMSVLSSWGYDASDAVPANKHDIAKEKSAVIEARGAGQFR